MDTGIQVLADKEFLPKLKEVSAAKLHNCDDHASGNWAVLIITAYWRLDPYSKIWSSNYATCWLWPSEGLEIIPIQYNEIER